MTVQVRPTTCPDDLPEGHRTCVYRVVQEALHNIVQHSQAREAQIAVKQESGRLLLSIHDDGKGFDPQKQRGMGLIGMEERVEPLGGKLTIESRGWQGERCCAVELAGDEEPIRILLADDHTIVRKGLRMLLESQKAFR